MTTLAQRIMQPDPIALSDDLLLKEANHRMANQLALLAGLVQMESSALAKDPGLVAREAVKASFDKVMVSILTMGKLHRQLAQAPDGNVELGAHLIDCIMMLFSALAITPRPNLCHRMSGDCIVSGEQAQFLALIAGEIITNAIKHAHPSGVSVQIQLACNRTMDGRILVEIGDDGVGLPEDYDSRTQGGLGFTLIRHLAARMNAELRIESDSLGLCFLLLIPKQH